MSQHFVEYNYLRVSLYLHSVNWACLVEHKANILTVIEKRHKDFQVHLFFFSILSHLLRPNRMVLRPI